MATIVTYRKGMRPVNAYPTRIVSPERPSACCTTHMHQIGDLQIEGSGLYYYQRCRRCGYELAETVHTMTKSRTAFRLICKREHRRQLVLFDGPGTPYVYHVIATNWPPEEKTPYAVLLWHNQRGQAENLLKELKIGLGMERMPCGDASANAVWFRLGVLAYNLAIGLKRLACPTAWAHHTIATLRWTLVQVAGRIIRHAGQVVLKLVIDAATLARFRGIRQQCWALQEGT